MNWIWRVEWIAMLLVVSGTATVGARAAEIAWHTDVGEAWRTTQHDGRPLLVFVTRGNCLFCTQMKDRTYGNAVVAATINQSFVPLVLDGGGNSPLLKELHVTMYPSTFVISRQAVIVERIDGYVPPEALVPRLDATRPRTPIVRFAKDP